MDLVLVAKEGVERSSLKAKGGGGGRSSQKC